MRKILRVYSVLLLLEIGNSEVFLFSNFFLSAGVRQCASRESDAPDIPCILVNSLVHERETYADLPTHLLHCLPWENMFSFSSWPLLVDRPTMRRTAMKYTHALLPYLEPISYLIFMLPLIALSLAVLNL